LLSRPLFEAGSPAVLGARRRVDHHGQVHVVEVAEAEQLAFAAQELQLPRARLRQAPLEVAALFGGHRKKHHPPRQVFRRPRIDERHRGAEQRRDLGVVAARVDGAGLGIGVRMSRHPQRVEFPEEREPRTLAGEAGKLGPDPGQRQAGLGCEAEPAERVRHEPRGPHLLEAQLGVLPDGLADADDLLGSPINGGADLLLELLFCAHQGHSSTPCLIWPTAGG